MAKFGRVHGRCLTSSVNEMRPGSATLLGSFGRKVDNDLFVGLVRGYPSRGFIRAVFPDLCRDSTLPKYMVLPKTSSPDSHNLAALSVHGIVLSLPEKPVLSRNPS